MFQMRRKPCRKFPENLGFFVRVSSFFSRFFIARRSRFREFLDFQAEVAYRADRIKISSFSFSIGFSDRIKDIAETAETIKSAKIIFNIILFIIYFNF